MRNQKEVFDLLSEEEILKKARPRNNMERTILYKALEELGEYTTAVRLSQYLKISKASVYKAIDERKIITYKIGRRHIVITRSILNIIEFDY